MNPTDRQSLIQACEEVWRELRASDGQKLASGLAPAFRAEGFPVEPHAEGEVEGSPAGSADDLVRFFREGSGLTSLHHVMAGAQALGNTGVVQLEWVAEQGIGEQGSARFVSGRATLTFARADGQWRLAGWLGTPGPHRAQTAVDRAADVEAIREQILRVFEAYRQKDEAILRRTHTADWRGFALSSGTVGKGIHAYMSAAQRAMLSVQFEEYRILELDAVFYGDIAIVPYVAVVAGKTARGRREESRLRVIDVYLREPGGWNQVASNVCLHPEEIRAV